MDHNIILLFGGDSDERLVSVASAQAMAQAIGCGKLWFWHKDGPIFDIDYNDLIAHEEPFTSEFIPKTNRQIFANISQAISSKLSDNHVFLLGVHGGSGENGELQQTLEEAKRPFSGSNAKASRIAFNKVATKECLLGYQIKMAPHVVLETTSQQRLQKTITEFCQSHGDCIIKPVCGGSSLGCFFVRGLLEINAIAAQLAELKPQPFLLERVINGREITVGVFEDDNGPRGLPCTEIVVDSNREFDYQGKYLGMGTKEITPARISENLAREAQRLAVTAHAALALDGYSRADLILADDGFYFLETNTLPGLTKTSLVPQQLAADGISMREFLEGQIKIALDKVVTAERSNQ
ncbi:MAG TPA: ATP-grasp domain-containing protein [Myxococcota bacterium]|nr:ATP-grasp domain-containing protein [Myxococcota bacterium]